jgi:RHS repeat-associated protein
LDLTGTVHGGGGVGGLLRIGEGTASRLPVYDGNGTVHGLLDGISGAFVAAYSYSASGEIVQEAGSAAADNPIRFASKWYDTETALCQYNHRCYSPAEGRFINRDPIGENGGLNLYACCGSHPAGGWDLLGLDGNMQDGSFDEDGSWVPDEPIVLEPFFTDGNDDDDNCPGEDWRLLGTDNETWFWVWVNSRNPAEEVPYERVDQGSSPETRVEANKPGKTPPRLWPPPPKSVIGDKPKWNPDGYWEGKAGRRITWDDRSHGTGHDRGEGAQEGHWDGQDGGRWRPDGTALPFAEVPDTETQSQIGWGAVGMVVGGIAVIAFDVATFPSGEGLIGVGMIGAAV